MGKERKYISTGITDIVRTRINRIRRVFIVTCSRWDIKNQPTRNPTNTNLRSFKALVMEGKRGEREAQRGATEGKPQRMKGG